MPELLVQNLDFSYADRIIFSDFSLSLSGVGIYTLIGPSGSGKTTLLRLLLGLNKARRGLISLSDAPASVFQEYRLFPHLSAAENVAIIKNDPKAHLVKARRLLNDLGLNDDDTELLPSALSGGMKQRVSIARALFSDAKILLLDEPTKELDASLRARIYELLRERAKDTLIILSTHRAEETEILGAKTILLK